MDILVLTFKQCLLPLTVASKRYPSVNENIENIFQNELRTRQLDDKQEARGPYRPPEQQ